ncbi:MG2 domain-containing protein [Tahibacter amnicola]|uniref:MG2 domain-containing protein n=1 Tax=Tahibacter amnicola TaxID=2976241 RepID=A0ABY6BCJ5_9GAMM|nr:MG2 domain-containing protein [Tahibacter amnicola]UXI67589.1 MG2 domain-containing protein [Tahibacter amnicola]
MPANLSSGYRSVAGAPFFVLADSGFTTRDEARVRLEGDPWSMEDYAGIDIVLYRVPNPMTFLKAQKDLHRVSVAGEYTGEGLANVLAYLWDRWFKQSRMSWQQLFTVQSRRAVVETVPTLKQDDYRTFGPQYQSLPRYRPLKQFEFVSRFRYPVQQARPIKPPDDTKLEGSSSNFVEASAGNVYVPLGKLTPGLYFVEAYLADHRATTLVFVSDTIAVTKTASRSLLVWTADKTSGEAVGNADVVWTDGSGVLKSGVTDRRGLLHLEHDAPQKSYVIGRDRAGGVFVSENFYYDSEIYDTKVYLFTDRPLYKPGDTVRIKAYARHFTGARESRPIEPIDGQLEMVDAMGQVVMSRPLRVAPGDGGDLAMPLPDNAVLGGYELRLRHGRSVYGGAFRVANYARPHFQADILFDRPDFRPGEAVTGRVALRYADGTPVREATVTLGLKSQALSMVAGEAAGSGRFPIKLDDQEISVGKDGTATFSLPAASVPSRYVLQAHAAERGTFPVVAEAEIVLQAGAASHTITPSASADPDAPVTFRISDGKGAGAAKTWEAIRLEDRSTLSGKVDAVKGEFTVAFDKPGGYSVFVRDNDGKVIAQTAYTRTGAAAATLQGIRLRSDKARYQIGDTAQIEITFPQDVKDALLTLERDQIDLFALGTAAEGWLSVKRDSARQWKVSVPVKSDYSPNMSFSVLAVGAGTYEFQNLGLLVAQPSIDLAITSDKPVYRPGETVEVTIAASVSGKPVSTVLTASVVDEMVYVLQPEVAPGIFDFFYHPRRNSVRTTSSLNFYGYDLAWTPEGSQLGGFAYRQRDTKMPLRSRRENIDTAAWEPTLRTNDQGKVSFRFVMPDSLSRWRITARALSSDAVAGQGTAHLRSSKPVSLRWTGPTRFRGGDKPVVGVAVFNETAEPVTAQLAVDGIDSVDPLRTITLAPGANVQTLSLSPAQSTTATLTLKQGDAVADRLEVPIRVDTATWSSTQALVVKSDEALSLPADARQIQIRSASTVQDVFGAVADELVSYPYGCVEQTASRLIPLAMSLQMVPREAAGSAMALRLAQRIQTSRGRLAAMAGPDARFTWWGDQTAGPDGKPDLLLNSYAYFADWHASRSLSLALPDAHWKRLVEVYQASAADAPVLHRALAIWMMREMGLPTATLLEGLESALRKNTELPAWSAAAGAPERFMLVDPAADRQPWSARVAVLLWRAVAANSVDAVLIAQAKQAEADLSGGSALSQAIAGALAATPSVERVRDTLQQLGPDAPTMERALVLAWLHRAVQRAASSEQPTWTLGENWQREDSATGPVWIYRGPDVPQALQFTQAPAQSVSLRVSYDAAEPAGMPLSVSIERHLYKVGGTGTSGEFEIEPVMGELEANALYVDEIVLKRDGAAVPYGLIEVPIPPGTQLEPQRFGFAIGGLSDLVEPGEGEEPLDVNGEPVLNAAAVLSPNRAQVFDTYYAVPVEQLSGKHVVRHLLRLGGKGQYAVPKVRFVPMYTPATRAVESESPGPWVIR